MSSKKQRLPDTDSRFTCVDWKAGCVSVYYTSTSE